MPAPTSRAALLICTLASLGLASACDSDSKSKEISPGAAQETQAATAMQAATPPDGNVADPADTERPQKIEDLATLCAALDKDYVDGTLSDYYAKVEMKTQWGKDLRKSGSDSIKPARELEAEVAKLDPEGKEPRLASCRTLLDYIDDVE